MMNKYYINASEVATAIGKNRHSSPNDITVGGLPSKPKPTLISRLRDLSDNAITTLTNRVTDMYVSSDNSMISAPSNIYPITNRELIAQTLSKCVRSDVDNVVANNTYDTSNDQLETLCGAMLASSDSERMSADSAILKEIVEMVRGDVRKDVGTVSEQADLDRLETTLGTITSRNVTMMYGQITLPVGTLTIGGKIDGMSNGIVVETKHRKYKLLRDIPIYERIQCHCYMFLTKTNMCIHVENFNGEHVQSFINFDHVLWEDVKTSLNGFLQARRDERC